MMSLPASLYWLQSESFPISNFVIKVEGKMFLCLIKGHVMKTKRGVDVKIHAFLNSALAGSGCENSCILKLSTSWRCSVNFMPWFLYCLGNSPQQLLDRKFRWAQTWFGHRNEETHPLPLPGIKPLPPSQQPVSTSTVIPHGFRFLFIPCAHART
jgi:hypothetical protein